MSNQNKWLTLHGGMVLQEEVECHRRLVKFQHDFSLKLLLKLSNLPACLQMGRGEGKWRGSPFAQGT